MSVTKSIYGVKNGKEGNAFIIENKNGLTYLSWAFAWAEVKKLYPDATYTIYEWAATEGPNRVKFTVG